MAAPLDFYTADMVRHLNDLHDWRWPRYETVHGELLVTPVAPRPWHEVVARRLLVAITNYIERDDLPLETFGSRSEVSWGDADILVQPDLFVVPKEEVRTFDWTELRHLLLAAEVLSLSSVRADRMVKRRLYQEQGVPLYWIVDPDAHTVEVWTPDAREARIEREMLAWHPAGAAAPFALALETLCRPV
jgi:Uma2 family endonuclease